MSLAPVVLFVFNRPLHARLAIEALQRNDLAEDSALVVYSDAARKDSDFEKVAETRKYLREISGFKSITIIEREKNWGLADSIIDGVTEVVNKYGKVIVIEDDLITSTAFLTFMNNALTFYEQENRVWHISGWNYPVDSTALGDAFLCRLMNCYGWATWRNRWKFFERNTEKLIHLVSKEDIKKFNFDDTEKTFWGQVIANHEGKMKTWAIHWYASIFINHGLCLNPAESFVTNIGFDGSGIHCRKTPNSQPAKLNFRQQIDFPKSIVEDCLAVERIKEYFKRTNRITIKKILEKIASVFCD